MSKISSKEIITQMEFKFTLYDYKIAKLLIQDGKQNSYCLSVGPKIGDLMENYPKEDEIPKI